MRRVRVWIGDMVLLSDSRWTRMCTVIVDVYDVKYKQNYKGFGVCVVLLSNSRWKRMCAERVDVYDIK